MNDVHIFQIRRSNLSNTPTAIEYHIASRIANATDIHEQTPIADPFVRLHLTQKSKWDEKLIIHYKHEARLETYKRDIHQLWYRTFGNTPVAGTKLIVGNRNSCNFRQTMVNRGQRQSHNT